MTTSNYVHRGDRERARRKLRVSLLAACAVVGAYALVRDRTPVEAQAEVPDAGSAFSFTLGAETRRLRSDLDEARGELDLNRAELQRSNALVGYSTRYQIPADLAGMVYDIALAEGIDPELGFRVVKLESDFNDHAVSPVGALGLTQLMPGTARYFEPHLTRDGLFDRSMNLRIGFRYLRSLLEQYPDVKTALLAYNRGPAAVESAIGRGLDPANGYDKAVLNGYTGKGMAQ